MAKDILGNILHTGDKIVFRGLICTVKDIHEKRILGTMQSSGKQGMTVKLPDSLVLEVDIQGDFDKPLDCYAVKTPDDMTDNVDGKLN